MSRSKQSMLTRPYAVLILIAISLAGAAIYSSIAFDALTSPDKNEPAVVLEIRPVVDGRIASLSNDLVVSVLVTAPLPPDMVRESGRDTAVVFAGAVKRYATISREVLGPIIKGWNELFSRRGVSGRAYIGLSVQVDVINVSARRSLLAGIESITLDLETVAKGYIGHYVLGIDISASDETRVARLGVTSVEYYDPSTAPINSWFFSDEEEQEPLSAVSDNHDVCIDIGDGLRECYKPTYYAGVDDFADALPSEYFRVVDGVTYMRVPVLVAVNDFPSMSATVIVSITTTARSPALGVYPTYAIGPNIAKMLNDPNYPEFASATVWKGGGLVWGGERFGFHRSLILHPRGETNTGWVWIYARPYIEIYSVYLVTDAGTDAIEEDGTYLRDDVTFSISDILLSGDEIESGYAYGMPHEIINNYFFEGTEEAFVTRLSSGGSIRLKTVFQACDKCGADFEIGIPVGAIVAAAASLAAPLSGPVAVRLPGFAVSLSNVGASIYIEGGVQNYGDVPGTPGDYDVGESVYVRVSKFRYRADPPLLCFRCSPCYYVAPVGMYLRFH